MSRLLLIVLLGSSSAKAAQSDGMHLELGVNPFEVSLTNPDSQVGVSRAYGTSGSLTVFIGQRLGFRLLGGVSWYSALNLQSTDVSAVQNPVVLPAWWGQGGVVWRFEPMDDFMWVDTHLDAGVVNGRLGLSQAVGSLVSAPLGTQASTSLGVSLVVRLERHIALNFGVRASVFGWAPARVAGCSDVDLDRLATAEQQGLDPQSTVVSASCENSAFRDLPAGSIGIARSVLQGRSSWVSGTLTFELGFAFF